MNVLPCFNLYKPMHNLASYTYSRRSNIIRTLTLAGSSKPNLDHTYPKVPECIRMSEVLISLSQQITHLSSKHTSYGEGWDLAVASCGWPVNVGFAGKFFSTPSSSFTKKLKVFTSAASSAGIILGTIDGYTSHLRTF